MTEPQNTTNNTTKDTDNPQERALLRERATTLGLKFSPNISNALLRARISAVLDNGKDPGEPGVTDQPENNGNEENPFGGDDENEEPGNQEQPTSDQQFLDEVSQDQIAATMAHRDIVSLQRPIPTGNRLTKAQMVQLEREKQWREQLRLVRIRVSCLNPQKKDLRGEVFTVSNQFLGTVRKFVPFGEATDNGYHVPYIIYQELLARQFQSITSKKVDNGGLVMRPDWRLVKEFAIELLPDLTVDELNALARTQTIAANQ